MNIRYRIIYVDFFRRRDIIYNITKEKGEYQ